MTFRRLVCRAVVGMTWLLGCTWGAEECHLWARDPQWQRRSSISQFGPDFLRTFGGSWGRMCSIMPAEPPDSSVVNRAIDIYLQQAYGPERPVAVNSMVSTLRNWGGSFYKCPVFVKDDATPPNRYSMRLGNRQYPHMKLVIEPTPDGTGHLFRADTHDAHCLPPPNSNEYAAVSALIEANGKIAQAIESAWRDAGLPTFRGYLQDALARRMAEQKPAQ
jgi:hypothetical protein